MLTSRGYHIVADLFGCPRQYLESSKALHDILWGAIGESGLSVVGENFYQFQPTGATGVLLLETSHICAHSWPEDSFLAVDVYSCSGKEKAKKAIDYILKTAQPERVFVREIERFK